MKKCFLFSNFDAYLASFLTTLKIWRKKISRPKKIGGNLSKIQTLAVRESVIDVLSEKLARHIEFIDKTYDGLKNPIDAARRWLGR